MGGLGMWAGLDTASKSSSFLLANPVDFNFIIYVSLHNLSLKLPALDPFSIKKIKA